MILLWGVLQDKPLSAVCAALNRMAAPFVFLDQFKILDTRIELSVDSEIGGTLQIYNETIDLKQITAVYIRIYDWRQIPDIKNAGQGSNAWYHAWKVEEAFTSWLEITPALVVNKLSSMASNNSKPYQSCIIRSLGFLTPETLITTDPEAAREFLMKYKAVVYKSISGVRSIVSRLTPVHLDRFDDTQWCPTQFQQYIPGTDYRVHVVGNDLYCSKIISSSDDYRYASLSGNTVEISSCDIPEDCAQKCRALAEALDLIVAGIDLRLTPDGQWYCFEVNPSPGFTYYQESTDQPIDKSIARLLVKGRGF